MYSYSAGREVKGDEPAEKHFWLLVNLVRSAGRAIDNRDIEQAIAEGCDTVDKVLSRFQLPLKGRR